MRKAFFFALCAAMIVAGGCAQPVTAPGFLPSARIAPLGFQQHPWMNAGLAGQDLLYVTNGNAEVTVYRYWQYKLVGVLTNFTQPIGICSDKNQNVYIADYGAKQILEYPHGGTKPIATFDDAPDSPYSCWVDPSTGNLAVANDDGTSQQGNVAIWSGGSTEKRTTYGDSTIGNFQFCAYDNQGNLLVTNGSPNYPYTALFAWLPKNGTRLIDLQIPEAYPSYRTWYHVSGLQWDGKYLVIDDSYALYRESLIHGQAYYVGATYAEAQEEYNSGPFGLYVPPGGEQATQVVDGMSSNNYGAVVDYWKYPAGGSQPIASINHALDKPFGLAISLKK